MYQVYLTRVLNPNFRLLHIYLLSKPIHYANVYLNINGFLQGSKGPHPTPINQLITQTFLS